MARQSPQAGGRQGSQRRDGCRRQHRLTPTPRRAAAQRPAAVAGTTSPPPSQGTPLARTHPTGRRAGHHLACGRGGQTSRSGHGRRPHTCAPPLPPLPCQQRESAGRRPQQEGAAAAAAAGRVRGSGGGDGDCRSQLARRSTPPPHYEREGRPERSGAPPTDRRGSWQAGKGGVGRAEKGSAEERRGLRGRSQGEEGVGRGGHGGWRGSPREVTGGGGGGADEPGPPRDAHESELPEPRGTGDAAPRPRRHAPNRRQRRRAAGSGSGQRRAQRRRAAAGSSGQRRAGAGEGGRGRGAAVRSGVVGGDDTRPGSAEPARSAERGTTTGGWPRALTHRPRRPPVVDTP